MLKLRHFDLRLLMLKHFDLLIQRRLLIGLLILMLKCFDLQILRLKSIGLSLQKHLRLHLLRHFGSRLLSLMLIDLSLLMR